MILQFDAHTMSFECRHFSKEMWTNTNSLALARSLSFFLFEMVVMFYFVFVMTFSILVSHSNELLENCLWFLFLSLLSPSLALFLILNAKKLVICLFVYITWGLFNFCFVFFLEIFFIYLIPNYTFDMNVMCGA